MSGKTSYANCTITGQVCQTAFSGCSGTVTISGTVYMDASFTFATPVSLVITGTGKLIFPTNAVTLTLPAGSSITINSGGTVDVGAIPGNTACNTSASPSGNTSCNSTRAITIGAAMIASCNGGGATYSFSQLVANGGTVMVVAAPATTICGGTAVNLTATPAGGSAPYTYSWDGTGPGGYVFSSVTQNPSVTLVTPGAYTYTVTITDALNSTSTSSTVINVQAAPVAAIAIAENSGTTNNDGILCAGAAATLTASGGGTYLWSTNATTAAISVSTAGTYTVTVTDAIGCSSTTSVAITVNPLPTAAISVSENSGNTNNDGIICAGATATLTASGGTSYLWNTNATTAAIAVTTAGTYTVTVTSNGCVSATSTTITVNPLPTAAITVTDNSGTANNDGIICSGATAALTASGGGTYLWSTTATTATINVTAAGTYTVVVTNANGCSSTTSTVITVNPLPVAAIAIAETSGTTNNDGILCTGASATLTASGGGTYLWSTSATTAVITVSTAGTYIVTVTNANGCSSTTSAVITVNPLPTASIAVTDNSGITNNDGIICAGATATLTASGGGTYLWSNSATTAAITVSTAGTYMVTVTNANGCSSTTSRVISVNPLPTASIAVVDNSGTTNNDGIICTGATARLTATGGTAYLWSTSATTAVMTVSTAGTYIVTVTNPNGCSATSSQVIVVNPLPVAAIAVSETSGNVNNDGVICSGASAALTASGGSAYLWSTNATTAAITVSTAGTFTVTVTNANGCSSTASTSITVNPLPAPVIMVAETSGLTNNDGIICADATVILTASGGTAYLWSTMETTAAITVSAAGTYQVTVTNANGCSSTTATVITVNPLPAPAVLVTETSGLTNNDGIICADATATLTATGGASYLWNTMETTDIITVSTAGTYTVTVTSVNGCSSTTATDITVNPLPIPAIAVTETSGNTPNDGVLCTGASATLTASGGVSYLWSTTATTDAITVSTAGTYTVMVTNADGCFSSTSVVIVVNPLPAAAIAIAETSGTTPDDGIICSDAAAVLTASGGTAYLWSTNATTAVITISTAGTYSVTVTNANGCSKVTSTVITVNPLPTAAITGNLTICGSNSTTLTASGGTAYLWSTTETTDAIMVNAVNTYAVTVSDVNGCTDTETATTLPDTAPPTITCPGDVTQSGMPGLGSCVAIVNSIDPVTTDNCAVTSLGYVATGATILSGTGAASGQSFSLGLTTVTYTAIDAAGYTATCSFTVTITPCVTVSGTIVWENNLAPVKDAEVELQLLPGLAFVNSGLTNINGNYTVAAGPTADYRVKPSKSINLLNGVNAADATRIQQHIINTPPLIGPYKRIAADVNKSNSITTYDATLITQAIAGNPAALATYNTSWRFVPSSYTFPNPLVPWGFPEKIDILGLSSNQINQNFIGIKIGDVNGSANPLLKPILPVVWTADDAVLKEDEVISVTIKTNRFRDIAAFQMALGFDPGQLEYVGVASNGALNLTDDNFGAFNSKDGEFRAVWSEALGRNLPDGTGVFTVKFKALVSGVKLSEVLSLNEQSLEARAYSTDLVETGMSLEFTDAQVSGTTGIATENRPELLQNRPNPFTDQTSIGFILPAGCDAQLRVYNINGGLVMELNKTYTAGYQQEVINLKGQTGVLYYELTTPFGTLARKMMVTN